MLRNILQTQLDGAAVAASSFDPEDTKYLRETFGTAVGAYVVGILVLLAFLLFFIIRWCCCCAGAVRHCQVLWGSFC